MNSLITKRCSPIEEEIYQQGFQAGAASRDAEIARLLEINSNICERSNRNITEIARLEKERDQLREILKDHGEIQAALCKETEELKERLK